MTGTDHDARGTVGTDRSVAGPSSPPAVTAFVCALFLGHDELVRVGALLVLLPLATAFFLGRSRYRLGLVRSIDPRAGRRRPAGPGAARPHQRRPDADRAAAARGPDPLRARHPAPVRGRPDGPAAGSAASATLVRSDVRGKFEVGPMKVRLTDPFGLVELDRTFQTRSSLVVTPRVVAAARRSRSPAPGPGPATTGRGRSRAAAPRTSPCGSTAAATTCAGCTGAAARTPAS